MGEARPWRLPIAFLDDELEGFEPLLQAAYRSDSERRAGRWKPGERREGVARAEAGAGDDAR
jgi:hypothetical protein